jgi:hypothetical protein
MFDDNQQSHFSIYICFIKIHCLNSSLLASTLQKKYVHTYVRMCVFVGVNVISFSKNCSYIICLLKRVYYSA